MQRKSRGIAFWKHQLSGWDCWSYCTPCRWIWGTWWWDYVLYKANLKLKRERQSGATCKWQTTLSFDRRRLSWMWQYRTLWGICLIPLEWLKKAPIPKTLQEVLVFLLYPCGSESKCLSARILSKRPNKNREGGCSMSLSPLSFTTIWVVLLVCLLAVVLTPQRQNALAL